MEILLAGYYGFKNLGDELLLYKIYSDINSLFPESKFYIWSGDKSFTRQLIKNNAIAINRFSVQETLQAIEESDIIIMGGGGLIHEYNEIKLEDMFISFGYNVVAYSIIPLFAKIYNKKVFYWGIGHGPVFTKNAINFAKWFYSLADIITVRDKYSYSSIKNIYPTTDNIILDIDPILDFNFKEFIKPIKKPDSKIIGINIRPWFNDEKIVKELSHSLNKLFEEFDFKIAPIPADLQLDKTILEKLSNKIPQEKILQFNYNDISDIISVISICDYFVGMRLHALMCAYKLSVPALGLSYDIKTDNFLESIGANFVNIAKSNQQEIELHIKNLMLSNTNIKTISYEYKTPSIFKNFVKNSIDYKYTNETSDHDFIEKNNVFMENFIELLRTKNHSLTQDLSLKEAKINELTQDLSLKEAKINELEQKINDEINKKNQIFDQLNQIYSSDFWKIASFYYKLKSRTPIKYIVKLISIIRREGIKGILQRINKKLKGNNKKSFSKAIDIKNLNLTNENTTKETVYKSYSKYDILFFSIIDWNFRKQRPQHLSENFSRIGHRIFYISPHFVKNIDNLYNISEINEKIVQINLKIPNNVEDYRIYNVDINLFKNDLLSQLHEIFKKFDIKDAVIITEYPNWFPILNLLKNKYGFKIVYDYLDDFTGFKETISEMMILNHNNLIKISDGYITTSEYLKDNLIKSGVSKENLKIVRNGTEFNYLNKACIYNKVNEHVTVGYYGAISDWFDIEKIEYIAQKKPEWEIILIGNSIEEYIEIFKTYKNINYIGEKPYNELINYLSKFDVALIPFKTDNNLIQATNPVKFYEYLSAGKPIVATNIPELHPYKDKYVYIADSKEEFLDKIEELISSKSIEQIQERIKFAKEQDWFFRAKEVLNFINNLYPLVSIIIISYNNKMLLKNCIESIISKTAYPNYEIIIVDNDSDAETKQYLHQIDSQFKRIKIIFNVTNEGFAKANNQGITIAKGKYIILLNNDTIVTKGWISWLIKHLEKDNNLKLVGPVTNSIGNEAKINVNYSDINQLDSFTNEYTFEHLNCINYHISVCALFCAIFEKNLINDIGYLDEQFEYGMFEDDDFSLRIKRKGYKIACVDDVFIHHFGGASFKKIEDAKYKLIFEKNKERFEKKWNIKWMPHKYRDGVI